MVEFAPVEKTPHRLKEKKDVKQGTIDNGELRCIALKLTPQTQTTSPSWLRGIVYPSPSR